MDDLTWTLKQLCRRNRDGSFATQADRQRSLTLMARQLRDAGFNQMQARIKDIVEGVVGAGAALGAHGGLDQAPALGQFQRYGLTRGVLGQDLLALRLAHQREHARFIHQPRPDIPVGNAADTPANGGIPLFAAVAAQAAFDDLR